MVQCPRRPPACTPGNSLTDPPVAQLSRHAIRSDPIAAWHGCGEHSIRSPFVDGDEAQVRDALERGEYLVAFEGARSAVLAGVAGVTIRWLGVLALARAGSTERARRYFDDWALGTEAEDRDPAVAEDLWALDARIAKDAAVAADRVDRVGRCANAARRYELIWDRMSRPYCGVNAATLWLLAGERSRASELAALVRLVSAASTPQSASDRYWQSVTLAECALIDARVDAASDHLIQADRCGFEDLSARSSTRRQLLMICEHLGLSPSLLDELPVPGVIHYTGHMAGAASGRFPVDGENQVRQRIRDSLSRRSVGFGYGSLGAGADIVVAEELLARGADLHVCIPCDREAFVSASVAPAGIHWVARFKQCLSAASSVTYLTDEIDATDVSLLAFNARVAMGSARLQAGRLVTEPRQLAVWDGTPGDPAVGTGSEVRVWNDCGLKTDVVEVPESKRTVTTKHGSEARQIRSVIVADFKGYGRLRDDQFAAFVLHVTATLAEVLDHYQPMVLDRNTWGDGLMVFIDDPVTAARCALELQQAVAAIDLEAHDLPADLKLRVSLHAGPMITIVDPVRQQSTFVGAQITRAARIEPATPEGEVYVTEAFAALLALADPDGITCQYVGREATAKAYGIMALYLLR